MEHDSGRNAGGPRDEAADGDDWLTLFFSFRLFFFGKKGRKLRLSRARLYRAAKRACPLTSEVAPYTWKNKRKEKLHRAPF